jgi:hypothetical protein
MTAHANKLSNLGKSESSAFVGWVESSSPTNTTNTKMVGLAKPRPTLQNRPIRLTLPWIVD